MKPTKSMKCSKKMPADQSSKLLALVREFRHTHPSHRPGNHGFWQKFARWAHAGEAGGALGEFGRIYAADHKAWSARYTVAKHYTSPDGRRQQMKIDAINKVLLERGIQKVKFYHLIGKYLSRSWPTVQRCMDNRMLWVEGLEAAISEQLGLDLTQFDKKPIPRIARIPKIKVELEPEVGPTTPETQPPGIRLFLDLSQQVFRDAIIVIDSTQDGAAVNPSDAAVLKALLDGETPEDIIRNRRWNV